MSTSSVYSVCSVVALCAAILKRHLPACDHAQAEEMLAKLARKVWAMPDAKAEAAK